MSTGEELSVVWHACYLFFAAIDITDVAAAGMLVRCCWRYRVNLQPYMKFEDVPEWRE